MEYKIIRSNPKECERELNTAAAEGWRVREFNTIATTGGGQSIMCVALLQRSKLRAPAEEIALQIGPSAQAA